MRRLTQVITNIFRTEQADENVLKILEDITPKPEVPEEDSEYEQRDGNESNESSDQ